MKRITPAAWAPYPIRLDHRGKTKSVFTMPQGALEWMARFAGWGYGFPISLLSQPVRRTTQVDKEANPGLNLTSFGEKNAIAKNIL